MSDDQTKPRNVRLEAFELKLSALAHQALLARARGDREKSVELTSKWHCGLIELRQMEREIDEQDTDVERLT